MPNLWQAMNVPLALVTGAAVASNPHIFGDSEKTESASSTVEAIRAQHAEQERWNPVGRRGPESPELLALRLAEDQFLEDSSLADLADKSFVERAEQADMQPYGRRPSFLQGLNMPQLPIPEHHSVEKYLNYFTASSKGRGLFTTWLKRSGRYRGIISKALTEQGLPLDLEAMVFIESGFWPTAKSSAGAVGLWQFMPATARAYGLTVTKGYDERRNVWRSSQAAAKHLSDLHQRLDSWDLALAAYNYGYSNVEGGLRRAQAEDFWEAADVEGALPTETRRYVPKILAVAVVLNNLDHFGFAGAKMHNPLRAAAFEVPPGTSLASLARAAGTTVAEINRLNPEFLQGHIPDRGSPVVVHVPRTGLARARVMLPRLLGSDVQEVVVADSQNFDWGKEAPNAERQARLDRTVGLSPALPPTREAPASAEPLLPTPAPAQLEAPVQTVLLAAALPAVPARDETALLMTPIVEEPLMSNIQSEASITSIPIQNSKSAPLQLAFIQYRVGRGDTLAELAKKFHVSERELVFDNSIRNRSLIYRGQALKIRDANKTPQRSALAYEVRRGDSLSKIAARLKATPTTLAKQNGISEPDLLQVGQVVWIRPG